MTTWDRARRILCVRLDNMGDVLMTTPAMQALAEAVPGRRLTLLTSAASARLAPHLPMIDDVIGWNAPWVRHADTPSAAEAARQLRACAAQLASDRYDGAVIFTVYSQSALPAAMLCTLARIPLRLAHCRENPYALLSHWAKETDPGGQPRHEARRQLDLVAQIGAHTADLRLRFAVHDADRAALAVRLAALPAHAPARARIVLHPGATAPSRRWPAEHFAAVAGQLARDTGALVFVTGSDAERDLVDGVCRAAGHPDVVPLAGMLPLGEFGALLEIADLLVSNNSGPVHIAAALGTPVVDLYALTNPQHTPWQVPHRTLFEDVPCRYCYKSTCPQGHHRCLRGVSPPVVVAAAQALLGGEPATESRMPWLPESETEREPAGEPAGEPESKPVSTVEESTHVHAWH
ncbi:lipopolysaccharide heptosyltransferase II [Cupriavidus pinatubonensis]|uniref:lipopolysaccharide heptosyltransferase II n=1 Tax=Cupriavidus pinatubonensis TaxID=248026 RepID=UPI001C7346C5|nr:lipopolysaccharide heptosyltransferase II [Cupriavidus pinatubonensis]QYY28557.1 lipopolysaccharide heptosyltransferase II [Cupriavidus pinatubonensis]